MLGLVGLAPVLWGCGGDAGTAAEEHSPVVISNDASSNDGVSWGVGKDEGLPGDAPEAEEAEPAPVSAPTVRPPSGGGEIVDRDDHVDFALDFLGRQAYNSVDGLMGLYASNVRYFDRGTVSRNAVAADKGAYFERWPNRYYEIAGPVRATAGSRPTIRFDYAFAVSDFEGSGERTGRAWVELGLTPSTDGYVIASERGGTY